MVASSLNLLPLPSLSTANAFASAQSASAQSTTASASASASAQSTTTTMKSIGGHLLSRPRPRRKKMLSIGVEAMRNIIVTDSSSAANFVSIPASPFKYEPEHEHRFNDDDDVDGTFRSTVSNRKTILSITLSTPMMPMMPDLITPTPTTARKSSTRRNSTSSIVFSRKRVNKTEKTELSNNAQAQLPVLPALQVPTKKMKKAVRQMKKSVNSNDDDDTQDDDDDDDDFGLFVSFSEDDNDHENNNNNYYDCHSPLDNSSYLPVFTEGNWKQCIPNRTFYHDLLPYQTA